jgi:DNA-binding GntR family transcriptional regulator
VSTKKKPSLAQLAFERIRERILKGEYPPGSALSRRKLAEELGMSLLPISEALQRLDSAGLIETRPRAGTRVRIPPKKEVLERYMLREALESQAARLFSANATAKEREDLLRAGEQLDKLYAICDEGDSGPEFLYSVRLKHVRFHLRIAEGGRCTLLQNAIEREQDLLFNWLSDRAAQIRPLPKHYHGVLAEAVASEDLMRADEAAREHIRYAAAQLVDIIDLPSTERWRRKRNGD